ncbi:MFS transporter [Paraburkholderia bannensis]|uniref:MFS transporter n=1 Tax=Paraburkholderia bannensis TaxID=765414 RepID=UPI0038CD5999
MINFGLAWCALWLLFGREGGLGHVRVRPGITMHASEPARTERLPYRKILTDASVLSVFLLRFVAYWLLGQTITWLPAYLETGLGFSSIDAGRWFAVVIACAAPVSIGLSALSQRMLRGGASTREARARLSCIAMMLGALCFIALACPDLSPQQKVLCYALGGALPTLCLSVAPALLAEMIPLAQRASVIAINTAVASLGAAVSPAEAACICSARPSRTTSPGRRWQWRGIFSNRTLSPRKMKNPHRRGLFAFCAPG